MIEGKQPEEADVYNERSLRTLLRAIALSQGQFSLILVRCNYTCLQERLMQQLRERAQVPLRELTLPESVKTLYPAIQAKVWAYRFAKQAGTPLPALMILGLKSVVALDQLLTSTNQLRDEFRVYFPFPLVVWVTDAVLTSLIRFAPDFKSWAAASIGFMMTIEELINLLGQKVDTLLSKVLDPNTTEFPENFSAELEMAVEHRLELECALEDLQRRGHSLAPELKANVEFVRGCDDYATNQLESSIAHYQQSLAYWEQKSWGKDSEALDFSPPHSLERQGILLFYLGRCYIRWANLQPAESLYHWQRARTYLQQCIEAFEEAGRPELVAKFISELAEVFRQLGAWTDLQILAQKALLLHRIYQSPIQLAQDFGFLAEVACVQSNWSEANRLAQQAISTLVKHQIPQPQDHSFYLLLLAKAQQNLDQGKAATKNLEKALNQCKHQYDPQLYIRILKALRQIYFAQGQYLAAFQIKQQQRSIEQQYGFRAFIGAGCLQPHRQTINPVIAPNVKVRYLNTSIAREIIAAGRQQDVNRLVERISRNDHKLIVIHGPSGVGKSSIVTAGLIPALQLRSIGARDVLPIVLQAYSDWPREVGQLLIQARRQLSVSKDLEGSGLCDLLEVGSTEQPITNYRQQLIRQLKQNAERNLLTVLIFDQFEEFFVRCHQPAERQQFYEFLRDCLNTPFVKVILSMREDYLHYLLECERCRYLDAVNNDILNQSTRYYLGNLSKENTKKLIKSLTERSPFFHLESALIHQLTEDLAGELGEVRPIELQLVGAQLQEEEDRITTLEKYRQLGTDPKGELVERFLKKVIADCGRENATTAWKVLFLLAEDQGTRPQKTRGELAAALSGQSKHLDLILEIFVGSGLVFMLWESETRYQLIHDYLVERIRKKAELNLKTQLRVSKAQLSRVQKQHLRTLTVGLMMSLLAVLAVGFAWRSEEQRKRAAIAEINARLSALSYSSEALFVSHKEFDALIEGLRAGVKLKQSVVGVTPDTQMLVVTALQQAVYGVQERNRLEGHQDGIWGVSFSPDGQLIATASTDKTVKLWRRDGKELNTLEGHKDSVTSVSFSPDGQLLASTSIDKTIKLWQTDGTLLKTLSGHTSLVSSVSFSPDGQLLASGSDDKTIKLWNSRTGQLLKTIQQNAKVTRVTFSPDGEMLASASDDQTVKLWDFRTGYLLGVLKGHTGKVTYVTFSPDGQLLASASDDKTIKIWKRNLQGEFEPTPNKILQGHRGWVFEISFSPDSQLIVSASDDSTVKLWRRNGTLVTTFEGHSDGVTSVSFSPDGQTIASGSYDKTVKLWRLNDKSRTILKGHTDKVNDVEFSPDGQSLVSASHDGTVKLWQRNGKLFNTLKGHTDRVDSAIFSPDNQLLASASRDKTVKIWNRQGQLLHTLKGHQDWVLDVSFSPDGNLIASASRDQTVKIWNVSGKLLQTLTGHQNRVNSVTFSPDGQLLASASDDHTVKLWSADGQGSFASRPDQTLQGHSSWVLEAAFSPNSQLIATASYDNTVKLWRRDGSLLRTLAGHTDSVAHVSFSPDGQFLATTSWENTVQLWRLDDTLLKTLQGHLDRVASASFSPDGQTLASASHDKTVILWNLDLDSLLQTSCQWVQEYLQNNPKVREGDRHLCDSSELPTLTGVPLR